MFEVGAEREIKTSRETVWRHLTRVPDWPRWYPGVHGVDTNEAIHAQGFRWRSSGQMGRFLYRSSQHVVSYELLRSIEIEADRRPWLTHLLIRFSVEPKGPNSTLSLSISATPGFRLAGRVLLSRMMKRRLQAEADQTLERLASYLERTTPAH